MKVYLVYRKESVFDYFSRKHTTENTVEAVFSSKQKAASYAIERIKEGLRGEVYSVVSKDVQ